MLIRAMISDGDFGRIQNLNRVLFYMTIPVLIAIISQGDFRRYKQTLYSYLLICFNPLTAKLFNLKKVDRHFAKSE